MKILPGRAEQFHEDRWTDRHDSANSRSYNFVNKPINSLRTDSRVNVICKISVCTSQRTPSVTIIKIIRQIVLREMKIFILRLQN
jgi:hypothetical protein